MPVVTPKDFNAKNGKGKNKDTKGKSKGKGKEQNCYYEGTKGKSKEQKYYSKEQKYYYEDTKGKEKGKGKGKSKDQSSDFDSMVAKIKKEIMNDVQAAILASNKRKTPEPEDEEIQDADTISHEPEDEERQKKRTKLAQDRENRSKEIAHLQNRTYPWGDQRFTGYIWRKNVTYGWCSIHDFFYAPETLQAAVLKMLKNKQGQLRVLLKRDGVFDGFCCFFHIYEIKTKGYVQEGDELEFKLYQDDAGVGAWDIYQKQVNRKKRVSRGN